MELTLAAIIHTNKILELATDLPKVVDIIDDAEKIDAFMPTLAALSDQAGTDGLITLENARVLRIENGQVKKA
jgi:PII-like signaling protein